MSGKGHNAAGQLKSLVDRIENLESQIKELQSDRSDIYAEAKGAGYDVGALKDLVKQRRQDAAKREEREQIVETYRNALQGLADLPLGHAAMQREGLTA